MQLVVWQMARPQLERGQMVSLLEGVNDATGIFIPFYLCTFAFSLGLVVLAWGLAAARAISAVMASCFVLGAAALAVAFAIATMWLLIVAAAMLLVGVGSTGLVVGRMPPCGIRPRPRRSRSPTRRLHVSRQVPVPRQE